MGIRHLQRLHAHGLRVHGLLSLRLRVAHVHRRLLWLVWGSEGGIGTDTRLTHQQGLLRLLRLLNLLNLLSLLTLLIGIEFVEMIFDLLMLLVLLVLLVLLKKSLVW